MSCPSRKHLTRRGILSISLLKSIFTSVLYNNLKKYIYSQDLTRIRNLCIPVKSTHSWYSVIHQPEVVFLLYLSLHKNKKRVRIFFSLQVSTCNSNWTLLDSIFYHAQIVSSVISKGWNNSWVPNFNTKSLWGYETF